MSDTSLYAPVCSVATTKRRRFLWAAWTSGPPTREPFRRPDAWSGGARSIEEALRDAERTLGVALVPIEARWARAFLRVLEGAPPWPKERADEARVGKAPGPAPNRPYWEILGAAEGASLDELKRAYRRRAKETHPDQGGSAEAFREVLRAWETARARKKKRPAPRAP
jgi:hypothetical protein